MLRKPDPSALLRVWDLPTRLTHGALVLMVAGALVTASVGADWMDWHMRSGHGVAVLLLFRWVWGFVGGYWSRFTTLMVGPVQWVRYLRDGLPPTVGHNPLGALSVWGLWGLLTLMVLTGWVADDGVAYAGPWVHGVTASFSESTTHWHRHWGQGLLWGWISLHLGAVIYHQHLRHEDLIGPMWHGDKVYAPKLAASVVPSVDNARQRVKAVGWFCLCLLGVVGLVSLGQAGG
ncbi:MAG: cytochrome b/b6 domain-containing protein [Leptothrix ochracea]|uniref:cytochrome b/b6 domain-containing protein n=1 Tax=Leptothrix ochracea TaxID=735331 RepID=UPI0034E2393F